MKLEKEVYIGNVYYTEYRDGKYDLKYNCIVSNSLSEKEKKIFDKLQEKLKVRLTLEVEEPILDEEERKYLSDVIRPFRDRVDCIRKMNNSEGDYITIYLKTDYFCLPYFQKETMYKGLELDKEYTLEDLGL